MSGICPYTDFCDKQVDEKYFKFYCYRNDDYPLCYQCPEHKGFSRMPRVWYDRTVRDEE